MNTQDVSSLGANRLPNPNYPHHTAGHDATLLSRMLDEIDYGLLLIARDGRLLYANQLALQELRSGGSLQLSQGLLVPVDEQERGPLCAALAAALRGRRTLLTMGRGGHSLSVAVVPMEEDDEPLALLVLNKRQSCTALTVDFYARAKGLTGAEATVLLHLSQGARPKGIASHLGVALSTVRSQISSIREKTQTASISELADQVAKLPPFAPALKSAPTGWGLAPELDAVAC